MRKKAVYIGHGRCGELGLRTALAYKDRLDIVAAVNHRETSDAPDLVPALARQECIPVFEGRTEQQDFVSFLERAKPDFWRCHASPPQDSA